MHAEVFQCQKIASILDELDTVRNIDIDLRPLFLLIELSFETTSFSRDFWEEKQKLNYVL